MSDSEREQFVPADGRIATIDVLRGIAILGVIIIHLWQATTYELGSRIEYRRVYLERAWHALGSGDVGRIWGSLWESMFALGDYGVIAFMVLSGVSLTLAAMRREQNAGFIAHYRRRLPKLLIPYWVGWALYVVTVIAVAWYSSHADGGTFHERFHAIAPGNFVTRTRVISGLLLVPRGLRLEWAIAPMPSLWFVLPMVQYYLVFPVLFVVLKRIGPAPFFAASFVMSLVSTLMLIWIAGDRSSWHGYFWGSWAPFRIVEFAAGMSVGYVAYNAPQVMSRLRSSGGIVALIACGAMAVIVSALIDGRPQWWDALAHPVAATGVALLVMTALVWQPRPALSLAPVRLLGFVGVMSYAVLIVNDCMRVLNNYFLWQGWRYTAGWWYFIVALYVPLGVVLAYPLASLLGLLPRSGGGRRTRETSSVRTPTAATEGTVGG